MLRGVGGNRKLYIHPHPLVLYEWNRFQVTWWTRLITTWAPLILPAFCLKPGFRIQTRIPTTKLKGWRICRRQELRWGDLTVFRVNLGSTPMISSRSAFRFLRQPQVIKKFKMFLKKLYFEISSLRLLFYLLYVHLKYCTLVIWEKYDWILENIVLSFHRHLQ